MNRLPFLQAPSAPSPGSSSRTKLRTAVAQFQAASLFAIMDLLKVSWCLLLTMVVPSRTLVAAQHAALLPPMSRTLKISGDFNPIHFNTHFYNLASLPANANHGLWSSAAAPRYAREPPQWAAQTAPMRKFSSLRCSNLLMSSSSRYSVGFVGMALPRDEFAMKLRRTGMLTSNIAASAEMSSSRGEKTPKGAAEVTQPAAIFVFTCQRCPFTCSLRLIYRRNRRAESNGHSQLLLRKRPGKLGRRLCFAASPLPVSTAHSLWADNTFVNDWKAPLPPTELSVHDEDTSLRRSEKTYRL